MSRGRLVWLVTLPKSALVGSVFGFVNTARLKALRSSILNCPRTRPVGGTCLTIEISHRFRYGLRGRRPSREVAHVVRQADPRVGALLDRIVHAVGLDCGVVEVEAADVEHRDVGVVRVVAFELARIAVEVDVAAIKSIGRPLCSWPIA